MLRQIRLKNFVHFEEEQTLNFEDGPYIFVGENGSGKSCTLEALRRCMSTSMNLLVSSSYNRETESVVICKFWDDENRTTLFSGFVRIPYDDLHVDVKMVCETHGKTRQCSRDGANIFVDFVKANEDGILVNREFNMDKTTESELVSLFSRPVSVSFDDLISCIRTRLCDQQAFITFRSEKNLTEYNEHTGYEKYVRRKIDRVVAITDPMRSIGCLEWIHSKRLGQTERSLSGNKILQEMQDRCEILHWYFTEADKGSFDDTERQSVRRYFAILTDKIHLTFGYENGSIRVRDNERYVSLEKVPEGIFEAKICAILLGVRRFKTICLDEPGRGMHPQMAERMRELILRRITDRTVIVTSHVPSFLSSWNIQKTFFFRRIHNTGNGGNVRFKVIAGANVLPDGEQKTPRLMTSQHFPTLFFARRILLVEGDSETLLLSAMKHILLGNLELLQKLLLAFELGTTTDRASFFLSSLHILPMNGEPNKFRLFTICNALELEKYFILDFDAIVRKDSQCQPQVDHFFNQFGLADILEEYKAKAIDVTSLEKRGFFVFRRQDGQHPNRKVGTLEDALIDFINSADKGDSRKPLRTLFIDNHVGLKWKHDAKFKKDRHKLFCNESLKDENIEAVAFKLLTVCVEDRHKQTISKTDIFRMLRFVIGGCCRK